MNLKKFDKEMLAKLPPELQKDIEDGNVVAVPMARPDMSSTFFTVTLAILVAGTMTPLFIPASGIIVAGLGLAAMGWLIMYAVSDRVACKWQNQFRLADGLLEGISRQLDKALQKQEDTDGTKSESVCLKEGSTGSDEVQGDGE